MWKLSHWSDASQLILAMLLLSELSSLISAIPLPSSNSPTPGHSTTGGRVDVGVEGANVVVTCGARDVDVPSAIQPVSRTIVTASFRALTSSTV
jgi:hypothetical protein